VYGGVKMGSSMDDEAEMAGRDLISAWEVPGVKRTLGEGGPLE